MGKHGKKEKRIRKVAEAASQSEKLRNAQKLPEIIPESALFEEDNDTQKKKKKIVLHPRPVYEKEQKTADEELEDIWGKKSISTENHPKPKGRFKPRKSYPTSNMAYNSATNVVPIRQSNEEQEEQELEQNIAVADELVNGTIEEIIHSDGIGDSLAGDVPNLPETTVKLPEKVFAEKFEIQIDGKIPKTMPDDQKKIKYKQLREDLRRIQAKEDAKILPEFEKTKEYQKEIEERIQELASRPKVEKEDRLMKFIPDEPEPDIHKLPENITELPAYSRPFASLQRKFEIERKTILHESKLPQ